MFDGANLCRPLCGSDEQCPPGLFCDHKETVCLSSPSTGKPMGAPCADHSKCDGLCIFSMGPQGQYGYCSHWCVAGGPLEPSYDCGGLDEGVCAVHLSGVVGVGDAAACYATCDGHDDCQPPNQWCFYGPNLFKAFCWEPVPCPKGLIDCAAVPPGMGGAIDCVETLYGPFCVDTTYDLGSQGTGGAGGA